MKNQGNPTIIFSEVYEIIRRFYVDCNILIKSGLTTNGPPSFSTLLDFQFRSRFLLFLDDPLVHEFVL